MQTLNFKADEIKGDVHITSTFVHTSILDHACQQAFLIGAESDANTDHRIDSSQQDMEKCLTQDRSGSTA